MGPYLVAFPAFAQWLGLSLVLLTAFVMLYVTVTPPREIALIREGNVSAAVCLSGTVIGFALPLASAMIHGANLIDFLIWGAIAAIVQLAVYVVMRFVFRRMSEDIIDDRMSVAVLAAGMSLAVGILNAAAMVG